MSRTQAKRWIVRGTVQGVGFRLFALREASRLGLAGWVRNLDSGEVEVCAQGPAEALTELAAALHKGPSAAEVRGVEEQEAAPQSLTGFSVR
jgi:acylphosphatase